MLYVHQNNRFGVPPPTAPYFSSRRGDFRGDGIGWPPRFWPRALPLWKRNTYKVVSCHCKFGRIARNFCIGKAKLGRVTYGLYSGSCILSMYSRRETLCFISFWANLTRSDSLSGTSAFMNTNCSCELLRIRPSQLQNKIYVSKLLTGWLSSMGFSSPKPSAWRFLIASKTPVFHPRLLNFLPALKSETFSTLPGKVRQNASFVSFSFASAVPWVGAAVSLPIYTGVLAAMWPCGIITLLCELFISESKSQVYAHLHQFLQSSQEASSKLSKLIWPVIYCVYTFTMIVFEIAEYICYDDGCHLHKYAQNPIRRDQTPTTQLLSKMEIVVDKMHMAGHVDKWCKDTCDPRTFAELAEVCHVCSCCLLSTVSLNTVNSFFKFDMQL